MCLFERGRALNFLGILRKCVKSFIRPRIAAAFMPGAGGLPYVSKASLVCMGDHSDKKKFWLLYVFLILLRRKGCNSMKSFHMDGYTTFLDLGFIFTIFYVC